MGPGHSSNQKGGISDLNLIQTRGMDLRYIPREVEDRDDEIKLHDVVATLLEPLTQ
jgi:hypothetical protein